MYHMAPDQLERYRAAVGGRPARAPSSSRVVGDARGQARLEVAAMETLKTAPRGYPKDHPRVELLRLQGPGGHEGLARRVLAAGPRGRRSGSSRSSAPPRPLLAWLRAVGRRRHPTTPSGPAGTAGGRAAALRREAGHGQRTVGVAVHHDRGRAPPAVGREAGDIEQGNEMVGRGTANRSRGVRRASISPGD